MLDKVSDKSVSLDDGRVVLADSSIVDDPSTREEFSFWSFAGKSVLVLVLALVQGALMIAIIFGSIFVAGKNDRRQARTAQKTGIQDRLYRGNDRGQENRLPTGFFFIRTNCRRPDRRSARFGFRRNYQGKSSFARRCPG